MLKRLTQDVSGRPLGLARIGVGLAAAIRAFVALPVLLDLAEPDTLRLPYADWLPDPSAALAWVIFVVWLSAAVAVVAGWKVPIAGPALVAVIVVTLSLDQQLYANHLYLMAWLALLLTLADSGAALSISGEERPVVRWPLLLLMAQVSIVYGFSALTKLNSDFMSGSVLASVLNGGLIPFPEALRTPGFLSVVAMLAVIAELFLAVFLWSPRLRLAAFVVGLGLHGAITLFMSPTSELIVFSLEMLSVYVVFLTDDGSRLGSVAENFLEPGHGALESRSQ